MRKFSKINAFIKIFELIMLCGIMSLLLTNNVFSATADPSYIYFDLNAGNVTISSTQYIGYIFETTNVDGILETKVVEIKGTHKSNNKYYVYQSATFNKTVTGLVDGQMIIPEYEDIYVDGKLWREYISNNTDILEVIKCWDEKTTGKRESTSNNILISGSNSNFNLVIDNIWSTMQQRLSMEKGSISVTGANTANTHVTINLKGDNRLANLRYYSSSTSSSLTINSFDGDKSEEGSLTVIGSQKLTKSNDNYTYVDATKLNITENHWDSVIGGTDSAETVKGLVFRGGTIYAGSTARENSTAIGGGGNGFGDVKIHGGNITAVVYSTGTAIGGGIAHTGLGGSASVVINDGKVFAYNFGQPAHDVIAKYGSSATTEIIKAARHIAGTAIGGASSIMQSGNSSPADITINGGYVYAESLGGCAIGGGNSVCVTAGSANVNINGGTVIANSKGQDDYTFSDNITKIDIKPGVSIGGGTGGITGNGGDANITIKNGNLTAGSIGGGSTTNPNGKLGYAKISISGGETSGQFIMVKGAKEACSFTMTGGKVYNSDTSSTDFARLQENGGAVYMDDPQGVATISGGSIENCKAVNGGAVYMTAGKFTLQGSGKITNCSASELGGAIYLGGTATSKGTFYIKNGSISSNKALNGSGGAIYLNGGNAYVSGGQIDHNESIYGGGAYLAGGALNITGGSINYNTATSGGGAYLAGGTLDISSGSIENNNASNGAGAFLTSGTLNISGGSINANIATNNGGGAYLGGGTLYVKGGSISANTATLGGGAYLAEGTLDISSGSIEQNNASNGAGAYLSSGTLQISNGSINNNTSTSNGGGAYLGGGALNISGGSINNNTATSNGGGAYLGGGALDISGGSINNNNASNGGGAYVYSGNITMNNGTFSYNTASKDGGGAYLAGGELNLSGGSFIYNSATVNGGGALVSNGKLNVTAGLFENNIASGDGGGAYIAGGDFVLNGPNAIFNNNCALNGGGVYLTGGEPNLFEGSLTNNIALSCGGGIYIDKQHVKLAPTGSVVITKNKAGYNQDSSVSAFDGFGGAIYISGTVNDDDASFSVDTSSTGTVLINQNSSKTYGGGVCINNGYFTMDGTNVKVTNNTALNGGGVAVMAGDFNISKGSIGEEGNANTAENGGGVYVQGGNVLIYEDGAIKNNIANSNGGGVYVLNGNLTMIGGTVENNSANKDGGGLFVSAEDKDVSVEILSGAIRNNSSKGSGGAFAVVGRSGGTENITVTLGVNEVHLDANGNRIECKHGKNEIYTTTCPNITFNTASTSGGAIYITGGKSTKLNLYCLEENNNKAEDGESRSNFMMVEGGTVLISTVEGQNPENEAVEGLCTINNSIHVTAGAMDLYGSMSNPKIDSPITVDITSTEDHYKDHRTDDGTYYKLQYYENFKNTEGVTTGQYTVYQIKKGTEHTISGVIYNHPGYEIIGWFTEPDGDGTKYEVGKKYLFDGNPIGDLTIYAIWQAHSYYVEFNANVPSGTSYSGTMEKLQFNYNTKYTLPANEYFYVGFIFLYWKDSDGKTYYDEQEVENLTAVDGKTIILYAQWEICTHTNQEHYHYTGVDNVITKECDCLAFKETATLVTLNTVYNEQVQEAKVIYSNTNWNLSISYEKGGVSAVPQNAGTYTATITYHGVTASAIHFIDKATQVAPSKPTYTVNKNSDGLFNNIVVNETVAPSGFAYEYLLEWYSGDELETTIWSSNYSFQLSISHTNYYVYIRYAGDDNHYPSEAVRADAVYYFDGYAIIKVLCPDQIEFSLTKVTSSSGIVIEVNAKDGYYLTSDFSVACSNTAKIKQEAVRERYLLYDIPSEGDVIITIDGFKLNPGVHAYVTENEIFTNFTTTSAVISKDSAFTVIFDLISVTGDYHNYSLVFNTNIPVGTSIIFVNDKTKEYKYLNVESSTNTIAFDSMHLSFNDTDSQILNDEQFRFIINFANCSGEYFIGEESITVSLKADKVNESDPCVVTLPNTEGVISLASVNNYVVEYNTPNITNPLEKVLEYSFAKSNGSTSKWDGKSAVLHFIPLTYNLPVDARLKVVIGNDTTIYHLTDNMFIVSLNRNINEYISITLESDMFGTSRNDFIFNVKLIASNSMSSSASLNGIVLDTIDELHFIKYETKEPSLKITIDKSSYKVDEVLKAEIDYQDCKEEHVISLTLMLRDDNFNYSSTGWSTNISAPGSIEIPLAGQNAGSYALTCVIKDESGLTILSVSCYFVVYN